MNKLHIFGYQFLLLRFSFIFQQKTHPNNGCVFVLRNQLSVCILLLCFGFFIQSKILIENRFCNRRTTLTAVTIFHNNCYCDLWIICRRISNKGRVKVAAGSLRCIGFCCYIDWIISKVVTCGTAVVSREQRTIPSLT